MSNQDSAQTPTVSLASIVRLSFLGLCLSVLCLTLWVFPASAFASPVSQIPIDYSRMTEALKASGIPLRLPTKVVYALTPGVKYAFFGVKGGPNDDGGYDIYIGHPDCPGAALSCTIAIASAELLNSSSESIEQAFPPLDPSILSKLPRVSPDPRGWVQLSNGQPAYFVPWVVGASMGFSQVIWDEGNYRYEISLKGGERAWLLPMAETALR